MDIYGTKPQLIGDKPEYPSDYDDLSDKAQNCYWELVKEWEDANPGYYFRANVWAWRPIHLAIVQANISCDLDIDDDTLDGMAYNSGHGLKTQEECNKLADALQELVDGMGEDSVHEYGFALGCWNLRQGAELLDEEDEQALNEKYPYGQIIIDMPIKLATKNKTRDVWPMHVTKVEHVKEFIQFLYRCGGFKIFI